MAEFQNFRSALSGFHRQDVVNYIEYINQKHNLQLEQLNTQLQNAREELARLKASPADLDALRQQLEEANERCKQLEAQLAAPHQETPADTELEAYRRAERAERKAQERATQIYTQANAVLAEATAKVETASNQMSQLVAEVTAKLSASKEDLQKAVDAMYAIRPSDE